MNKCFFFNFNYQININLLDKRSVDVIGFVYKSSKLRLDIISQFDSFNRDDKKRRQKKFKMKSVVFVFFVLLIAALSTPYLCALSGPIEFDPDIELSPDTVLFGNNNDD